MRVAIIGAGMSGLSLAVALAKRGIEADVYEADGAPPRTRTFCGFEVELHPFSEVIGHRWRRVAVATDEGKALSFLTMHPYAMIEGGAFVDHALSRLEGSSVRLHFGRPVTPSDLDAEHVFDSRPIPAPDGALLQVFRGRFVRTERPVFDPEQAMLMDFRVDQSRGVHFLYVLPTSETEALVEDTYFTHQSIEDADFERTLDDALAPLGPLEVIGTEGGMIPMSTEPLAPSPERVTRIGIAGGIAKPSTGYAFAFAQRHAQAIATALSRGEPPPTTVRSERDRLLDAIFLARLDAEPDGAPELFHRLFDRVQGDSLARFLMEAAHTSDLLAVMRSLPPGPFTAQAVRTLTTSLKRRMRKR